MSPVRLALYAGILLVALLVVSLASFWLAVRPPRLAIALRPDDYRLAVESVTIRAKDGVRLAGWFTPRPGAPAIVLLHGYPAEKADLLPIAAGLGPARYPFVLALRLWSRLIFGGDLTRPTPAEAAARLTIPVLLVHSREDEQISFRHAERLQAALAANRRAEFEFMARGRHGELPPGFESRLARFFRRALSSSARAGGEEGNPP